MKQVIINSEQLRQTLIKDFAGQKVCILNELPQHTEFLQKCERDVRLVFGKSEMQKDSTAAVLNFGSSIVLHKKTFNIAQNLWQFVSTDNCIVCMEFLNFSKGLLAVIISGLALQAFNVFCTKIFEVEFVKDASVYFDFLNKILMYADNNETHEVCNMLAQLRPCSQIHFDAATQLEYLSCAFLQISLCEHFLIRRPFSVIFNQPLTQKFEINFAGCNIDADEACFKLKEFNADFLTVCRHAKTCINGALNFYKRSRSDAGFSELRKINSNQLIKKMLSAQLKPGGLIGIMQMLGVV